MHPVAAGLLQAGSSAFADWTGRQIHDRQGEIACMYAPDCTHGRRAHLKSFRGVQKLISTLGDSSRQNCQQQEDLSVSSAAAHKIKTDFLAEGETLMAELGNCEE